MESFVLKNAVVYTENSLIKNGFVEVSSGKIVAFGKSEEFNNRKKVREFLLPHEWKVVPGFIDLHIHGAYGFDVMDGSRQSLDTMSKTLPKEGTTSFLATTMTAAKEEIETALVNIRDYSSEGGAALVGIHLEGPFLSKLQNGAQSTAFITAPNISLLQRWQKLSGGKIRIVTLAPEQGDGLAFVNKLSTMGITAAIGHSNATAKQTFAAINGGITHATHLFNGMRGLHHRQPGVVGAVLLDSTVMAELIVDGIHICPEMVQLVYRIKGKNHLILITDAIRAKGLGDGAYKLGNQSIFVEGNKAVLIDGTLAGSTLTMIDAIKNMINFSGCSFVEALQMATVNPAKQIDMFDKKGSIKVGKDADLVVLDERLTVQLTVCRGNISYKNEENNII